MYQHDLVIIDYCYMRQEINFCIRMGEGILTSTPEGTESQRTFAAHMVIACEGINGVCPIECELKQFVDPQTLAFYRDRLNQFMNAGPKDPDL